MGSKCMVWSTSAYVLNELPTALLIKFDKCDGVALFVDNDDKPTVPIFFIRRDSDYTEAQCSRQQLPVSLSYAITVTKSHRLILDRAAVYLTSQGFASDQNYVTIWRVRSLEGLLLFEKPSSLHLINRHDVIHSRHEECRFRKMFTTIAITATLSRLSPHALTSLTHLLFGPVMLSHPRERYVPFIWRYRALYPAKVFYDALIRDDTCCYIGCAHIGYHFVLIPNRIDARIEISQTREGSDSGAW